MKRRPLLIFICVLLGLLLGYLIDHIPSLSESRLIDGHGSGLVFDKIVVLLLIFYLSYYLQILLHEAGHLIFGLLSGYHFVSFRIKSLALIREGGHLRFRRYNVVGTGGQCLLEPPGADESGMPYLLYNLGGVLVNFVVSFLALSVFLWGGVSYPWSLFLFLFSILGILIGFLNGIPMKVAGTPNDGYNILLMRRDSISKRSFFLQLKINALSNKGQRLKDLPESWFTLPEGSDLSNPFHATILLLRAGRYLDAFRFEEAGEIYKQLLSFEEKLMPAHQRDLRCELVFLEIIGERRKDVIDEMLTSALQKYIWVYSKFMMGKVRLQYAYLLLVDKDRVKAEELRRKALAMKDRYPLRGDVDSELGIMQYLYDTYTSE